MDGGGSPFDKALTGKDVALKILTTGLTLDTQHCQNRQGQQLYCFVVEHHVRKSEIRQIYSQAYHHVSNDGVEKSRQQIMEILMKVALECEEIREALLPKVVILYHDSQLDMGLSPSKTVFGWNRLLTNHP